MSPTIPITNVYGAGTDAWNAYAYDALSLASKLSAALKGQSDILSLTHKVWKLDALLRDFLAEIYRAVENPPKVQEPITEETILDAAHTLRRLHQLVDGAYSLARNAGLTNHKFIGAPLNSIKVRSEEILEIGEALELALDPKVDAMLNRSIEDLHNGIVYDLPTLK
jgi:hypothetical protein